MDNFSIEPLVYLNDRDSGFIANVTFKIYFGGCMLELKDFALYRKDIGDIFLTHPSRKYQVNGKDKYFWITSGNKLLTDKLSDAAIEAYHNIVNNKDNNTEYKKPEPVVEQKPETEVLKFEEPKQKPGVSNPEDMPWEVDL